MKCSIQSLLADCPKVKDFYKKYNDEAVIKYATFENEDDFINGDHCSLIDLNKAYGDGKAQAWLLTQVTALAFALGLNEKTNKFQLKEITYAIYKRFFYLKYTEMIFAFDYLRTINYYGNFSISTILQGIEEWDLGVRSKVIEKREQAERIRKEEGWKKTAVPMPDFVKRHLEEAEGKGILNLNVFGKK